MGLEPGVAELEQPVPSAWEDLGHALSPIEERPVVIDGIESARFTTRSGDPYVVVHNPAAGTYLKLDPREYELLPLMDGGHTVKELVVEYYQRHGVLAFPRIAGLVRLLKAHRFLVDSPLDVYAALSERLRRPDAGWLLVRLARGFLQADVGFRNADGALAALYRSWGWILFTRPAFILGTVIGVLAPVFFVLELGRDRYQLFHAGGSYLGGLALMVCLGVVALAIHELGHAMAVKHAGRRVSRAGVMVYYGLPAGYVDTTDVWMAPRSKRLMTSFAGPWTGLLLGGVSATAAFFLPQGPLGAFLFVWGFVCLVDTLLNFNPLLELDGYYLLVDLVEKPMLRARALAFVRGPLWSKLRLREKLSGEERFFAFFGLASLMYSVLAVFLAIQIWQRRFTVMVQEAWGSGDPLARAGLVVLGLMIATPLVLGLVGRVRWAAGWVSLRLSRLAKKAASGRYREALATLRAVPLWMGLPEARLLEIARAMHQRDVAPGVAVVRQGDPGDRFYVIASGTFEVLIDGKPVARLGRGDYFGERALLNSAPRVASVLALAPGQVFSLDQDSFRATLGHDLAVRAKLEEALTYRADVAQMPILRDLAPAELDLLLARLVPVTAGPGEDIIRQGDSGDRFYLIRSGSVEVVRDGRKVATLGPGDAFGEIALLLDVPRTATVRALAASELLSLDASDFRDLLAGYCGRAAELERLSHLRLGTHKRLDQLASR